MSEGGFVRTLATINQVFAFKIPPQVSAAGHRADSWPQTPAWTGRMVITSCNDQATVELRGANGDLFAACPIKKGGPPAVQKVVDSSRYFVLRVVDQNSGRHAFIGIAFENRSDAFDFNVAIDDHQKEIAREETASQDLLRAPAVTKDYSLKQGETIRIKINTKKKQDTGGANDDFGDDDGSSSSSTTTSTSTAKKPSSQEVDLLGFNTQPAGGGASNWETF